MEKNTLVKKLFIPNGQEHHFPKAVEISLGWFEQVKNYLTSHYSSREIGKVISTNGNSTFRGTAYQADNGIVQVGASCVNACGGDCVDMIIASALDEDKLKLLREETGLSAYVGVRV